MLDALGRLIRLGDRVTIGGGHEGIVVFSIDTDEYSPEFSKANWSYLACGIMIRTERIGLVHLEKADEDTQIID